MASNDTFASLWLTLVIVVIWSTVAAFGGCSVNDDRFHKAIRNQGLEDPVKHGYNFFECGYGDVWNEGFTAKRPLTGEPGTPRVRETVSGTVCCGILKGCTVRWE